MQEKPAAQTLHAARHFVEDFRDKIPMSYHPNLDSFPPPPSRDLPLLLL
jgi:hypothetical protein